jgi:hypothetical protein
LSVVKELPKGPTRSFWFASALGKSFREGDKDFRPLGKGDIGKAVLVRPAQRTALLKLLGISLRHWERLVKSWEARNVAHRCGSGTVCLFNWSFETTCPNPFCGAELYDLTGRLNATKEVALPDQIGRPNMPKPGDALLGDEQGDERSKPLNQDFAKQRVAEATLDAADVPEDRFTKNAPAAAAVMVIEEEGHIDGLA